jgi:DNA-binding NarL/FixJ family response regulator
VTATILLADDHDLVRAGLRMVLEESGFQIVCEALDGHEAVRLAQEHKPDVVVLDFALPTLNGAEATIRIRRSCPATRVVALTTLSDVAFVDRMLRAGVSGYVLKQSASDELVVALRAVLAGDTYLTPKVAGPLLADWARRTQADESPMTSLSNREREVLQLVAEGATTKHIAATLGVSVKTIESHRHAVMAKLGLHSIAELTKYAARHGLTSIE